MNDLDRFYKKLWFTPVIFLLLFNLAQIVLYGFDFFAEGWLYTPLIFAYVNIVLLVLVGVAIIITILLFKRGKIDVPLN